MLAAFHLFFKIANKRIRQYIKKNVNKKIKSNIEIKVNKIYRDYIYIIYIK